MDVCPTWLGRFVPAGGHGQVVFRPAALARPEVLGDAGDAGRSAFQPHDGVGRQRQRADRQLVGGPHRRELLDGEPAASPAWRVAALGHLEVAEGPVGPGAEPCPQGFVFAIMVGRPVDRLDRKAGVARREEVAAGQFLRCPVGCRPLTECPPGTFPTTTRRAHHDHHH